MADARRPPCGMAADQRLAQHLAAEDALHTVLRDGAAKNILFDLFQIEQVERFSIAF